MRDLVLIENGEITQRVQINPPHLNIGSHSSADVRINDQAVNGLHAKIYCRENVYLPGHFDVYIEDLESDTGIFVNGTRTRSTKLENKDEITIAGRLFRFVTDQKNLT